MKPPPFDYARPETVEEVLDLLRREGPEARILAGGQSLVPMLSMRLARPSLVVDIAGIDGLAAIERDRRAITVGAGARQADLAAFDDLEAVAPLLAAALPWVGHHQTRSRGTVVGSIAHADPSAELPLCLLALQGDIKLRSASGSRVVAADDFFLGMMTTARREDELIEAVRFPLRMKDTGYAFHEFGRRHGDFAIVAVAASVASDSISLAVGGVGDVPTRRRWSGLTDGGLDDALNDLAWQIDARDDLHASARLRRDLVRSLGATAIAEARRCAA